MKPYYHKVPLSVENSFSIRHEIKPNFGTIWHYHPELELHYVIKGEGMRFIGDNISTFTEGEIILLGQNLPHTWRCNQEYFNADSTKQVEAIVIQFSPYCLGGSFLNLPEAYQIPALFEKASKGLIVKGESRHKIASLMKQSVTATGMKKLILLLSILEIFTETEECLPIAVSNSFYGTHDSDITRLNKIYNYTFANYGKEIPLGEIAAISNLSPTYFCRYFKQMTNKTYNDFLTSIRIGHACRLLIENQYSVEVIAYDCGFNNASNFFRHFRKVKGMSPSEYRKKYLMRLEYSLP